MAMAKIRSTMFLTMGLSLLLLGTLAAQDHDRDSGEFVILNAQYGTEHQHVDVTRRLRELARHDQTFRVEYNTINADPAPGRAKMLRVYARQPNGLERFFDFPESFQIVKTNNMINYMLFDIRQPGGPQQPELRGQLYTIPPSASEGRISDLAEENELDVCKFVYIC